VVLEGIACSARENLQKKERRKGHLLKLKNYGLINLVEFVQDI